MNAVRKPVSKRENRLSALDSEMLIALAEELANSAGTLLGETVSENISSFIKSVKKRWKVLIFIMQKEEKKILNHSVATYTDCVVIIAIFAALIPSKSSYLN